MSPPTPLLHDGALPLEDDVVLCELVLGPSQVLAQNRATIHSPIVRASVCGIEMLDGRDQRVHERGE
jgi:hypothetical protein